MNYLTKLALFGALTNASKEIYYPGMHYFKTEENLTRLVDISDGDSIITQPYEGEGRYYAFLLDQVEDKVIQDDKPQKLVANHDGSDKQPYTIMLKIN